MIIINDRVYKNLYQAVRHYSEFKTLIKNGIFSNKELNDKIENILNELSNTSVNEKSYAKDLEKELKECIKEYENILKERCY